MRNKLITCIVFITLILALSVTSYGSEKKTGIENFPNSYKPYLYELKNRYPNWEFTAIYTGIDWNTAVLNEYANDKNLVPIIYSDNWKCINNNKYNVQIDPRMGKCFKKSNRIHNGSKKFLDYNKDISIRKIII